MMVISSSLLVKPIFLSGNVSLKATWGLCAALILGPTAWQSWHAKTMGQALAKSLSYNVWVFMWIYPANFGFNRIWRGCNRNPKHNCCLLGIAILDDDEWWLPMIVPHILASNHQPTWFCESKFLQLGVELGSAQFSRPAWSPFQKVKHSSTELSKCSKRVKKEISYGNGFV